MLLSDLLNYYETLPEQSGNDGKYLTTDGTSASWVNLDDRYYTETEIDTSLAARNVANDFSENSVTTIARPGGASYSSSGAPDTGAIKITLPQSWTRTMMTMAVDVYNWIDNTSFTAYIGGYNNTGGPSWIRRSTKIVGYIGGDNRVRLGHDGSKCCIVIGETTSEWYHPKIRVRDFQAGHKNYTIDQWKDGWSISIESDVSGITFTGDYSDALIDAYNLGGTTWTPDYGTGTVDGDLDVTGALSKGSGTFKIDHPLDSLNKILYHSFIEAPRYDLIYRGEVQLVDGKATVDIDAVSNMQSGTFAALTQNAQVTSLQNQTNFSRLMPGTTPETGQFEILCEDKASTDTVVWVVIAERADPHIKALDITDADGHLVPERDKQEMDPTLLEPMTETIEDESLVGEFEEPVDESKLRDKKGYLLHKDAVESHTKVKSTHPTRTVTRVLKEEKVKEDPTTIEGEIIGETK